MSMLVSSRLLTPVVGTGSMIIYDNTNGHNNHDNSTTSLPKHFNVPFAIQQGYFRCIRYLLQLHYDPNERDSQLRTPLILCAYIESDRWSVSIAQNLLEKGAKVALEDHARRNAMHHACALQRLHLVQLYLSCLDFDINAKDCEGNTCLHYAAIAGNSTIAELLMRSAEKAGVRLDQYTNREGCSPAALALKYGHFECANQITHCDCDEFFVVPRPLSIYEHPSNTDGNQTLKSKTKRKSNSHQSAERRSSNRPSSLSFGLLKIIFNDGDANYSNRLAGLCQQAKQHPHRQSMKHNKHEAPQTSITTINKLDRTKSILVNGALYSSTEAVVNETHSTKERQKSFDTNGNHNNSNRTSPRAQILLQPNHLNKSNLSELNSSFIQKTTSKTQLSINDLNITKGNLLKTNDEENKLKINKATVCTQTSHSALNYSDNNNNSKAKTKLQNTTTSSLNNPTYIHSSLSQASSAKTKPTTAGLSSTKKSSASNDPIDSITNLLPKQNHSFFSSDSSSYSQTIYAGRSVSALLQQPTNSKSNESSCSIREAKGRKCRYNKPEELFGVRPEELFAPEQHQPKIFDPNSSSKLNDSQRLKRSSLQKYIWQQDVDKIIDLYNIHHCSNYRKTAVPPSQATPATQSNGSNETNNESALMNRPRRVSISKNSLVNSKSSLHSKQSVNTSVNMTRRNSIIRPTIKLTNG